jgi:hypothetical protein
MITRIEAFVEMARRKKRKLELEEKMKKPITT